MALEQPRAEARSTTARSNCARQSTTSACRVVRPVAARTFGHHSTQPLLAHGAVARYPASARKRCSLNAVAGKLGLTCREGRFWSATGEPVSEEDLLRHVFSTRRTAGDAFRTFRRLLQAGMSVAPPNPVPPYRLLAGALRYTLRDGQQRAFQSFLESGNVGIYWPPGVGKMYFLGMVFASLAGEHVLFVHTRTIRDQWLAFFRAHALSVRTAYVKTPHHYRVDILDAAGQVRSVVRIFGYQTRERFKDTKFVVAGFDESQFLPGNNASRLAMIDSEYRVGLSATPFREDGRADLIQMMTGLALGADWQEFKDAGAIADVPVRVLIVQDLEQKHRALSRLVNGHKTIIFSDAIADGKRISAELGIPFIHGETSDRLRVLADHHTVCMSRVGDCGIDTQDLEEVIEFNFHYGSRAQSLQRLGRLLHSRRPLRHTVMMTVKEFSLYHKRLSAMEEKGFPIGIEMYREKAKRGRPPAPRPVSMWAQLLGATPAPRTASPIETQTEKRTRVMRRIEQRTTAGACHG
jgi:superfamily II DNA or RNA helicase